MFSRRRRREAAQARSNNVAAAEFEATAKRKSIEAFNKAIAATNEEERFRLFDKLTEWDLERLNSVQQAQYHREFPALKQQYTDQLLTQARAGNAGALYLLDRLIGEDAPADWNDLVARTFEAPELRRFRLRYTEDDPAVLQLMAANALRRRSLTDAKVLLAISHKRPSLATLLRVNELADLVVELHEERGLFQGWSTVGT